MNTSRSLSRIPLEWPIRIGAGIMYLYSGVHILKNPVDWVWAIPQWFTDSITVFIPLEQYLKIQGAGEILLGLLFFSWFLPSRIMKYVALFATGEILAILLLGKTGIDLITFRDIGILGGFIAMTLIYWTQSPFRSE